MSEEKILKFVDTKSDVRATVEDCLEWCDGLSGIMIVGLTKEGAQVLRPSTMSGIEKSFLVQFLNAWMAKWFSLENS